MGVVVALHGHISCNTTARLRATELCLTTVLLDALVEIQETSGHTEDIKALTDLTAYKYGKDCKGSVQSLRTEFERKSKVDVSHPKVVKCRSLHLPDP